MHNSDLLNNLETTVASTTTLVLLTNMHNHKIHISIYSSFSQVRKRGGNPAVYYYSKKFN